MNWDQLAGQWKQARAQVKSKWAKLTDDDLMNMSAKREALVGKIQERYGILKDEAESQVDKWIAGLPMRNDGGPRNEQPGSRRTS